MKLSQVLDMNVKHTEDAEETLQEWLRKIKPFAGYTDEIVPLEKLEKLIWALSDKYDIAAKYMTFAMSNKAEDEPNTYRLSFAKKNSPVCSWGGCVYGITIYEVFAKGALFLYANTRKQEGG